MKLFVLALFSLILSVSSEDEIVADPTALADQLPAQSLYEALFSDYYNAQPYNTQKVSNKKSSKSKSSSNNSNKNQGISILGGSYGVEVKGKQLNNNNKKKSQYEEYNHYIKNYEGHKEYDERLVGRKGVGFDKRSATSYGFRAPLTPEILELNGYYEKKENKEIYPLIL